MILALITLFIVKHFICDFPLQACPWMYRNKGTYGHLGGVAHAGVHMIGTEIVLLVAYWPHSIGPWLVVIVAAIDGIVHYHIDWAKVRIGACMGWGPTTSEWFWILLGADQLLHYLTYVGIVWWLA